jgi:outer membrane protein assembly factor BamD (BamD/ComL family)
MATAKQARPRFGGSLRRAALALIAALAAFGSGCTSTSSSSMYESITGFAKPNPYDQTTSFTDWFKKPTVDADPASPAAMGERTAIDDKARRDIEEAKQLYKAQNYAEAERKFNLIAKAKKLPADVTEDAVFYRGECQRLQANYRAAEGSLKLYIKSYPYGRYTSQANERLFDIANYWLNPTRDRMKHAEEVREGNASAYAIMPTAWFHPFDKSLPMNDVEGHAMGVLEEVRLNDIRGKLAEKSLFYIATVKFFNAEYKDADYYYSQLVENYPKSDLAQKAMKQSIICKQIANGGTAYDTRLVEKCRAYLEEFHREYPGKDAEWIKKQLISINHQQADRDYNIARFYERTGHPGSAYFYFEIVKRSYPNTEYARRADEAMNRIRGRVQEELKNDTVNGNTTPPWYQGIVDTVGPTRVILDPNENRGTPAPSAAPSRPAAPPGMLPDSLDSRKTP